MVIFWFVRKLLLAKSNVNRESWIANRKSWIGKPKSLKKNNADLYTKKCSWNYYLWQHDPSLLTLNQNHHYFVKIVITGYRRNLSVGDFEFKTSF